MIFTDTHTTDRPEGLQAGFFYLQYIQEVDARICTRTSTASVASLCFFLSFFLFNACRLFRSFIHSYQQSLTASLTNFTFFLSFSSRTLTLAPSLTPSLPPLHSYESLTRSPYHSLPLTFSIRRLLFLSITFTNLLLLSLALNLSFHHFHSLVHSSLILFSHHPHDSFILTLTPTLALFLYFHLFHSLPPSFTPSLPQSSFSFPTTLMFHLLSLTTSLSLSLSFSPPITHSVTLTFPLTFPLSLSLNRSHSLPELT